MSASRIIRKSKRIKLEKQFLTAVDDVIAGDQASTEQKAQLWELAQVKEEMEDEELEELVALAKDMEVGLVEREEEEE